MQAEILPITGSDHYPICVRIHEDEVLERCPFKFEKMWLREEGFLDRVAEWWAKAPQRFGNKDFIFFKKLQYIEKKLKQWNREAFKNIFTEKLRLEKELGDLHQKFIEGGMREEEFQKEKDLNKEYSEV